MVHTKKTSRRLSHVDTDNGVTLWGRHFIVLDYGHSAITRLHSLISSGRHYVYSAVRSRSHGNRWYAMSVGMLLNPIISYVPDAVRRDPGIYSGVVPYPEGRQKDSVGIVLKKNRHLPRHGVSVHIRHHSVT